LSEDYLEIELAYGREGLRMVVSHEYIDLIRPEFIPGLPDESSAIRDHIRSPISTQPLRDQIESNDKVVIVHTDITRATPNSRILPVLIEEILSSGVSTSNITLLNGLGTHRPQTDQELRGMLGDEIVDKYRCIQHNCFDESELVYLGKTSYGSDVRINKTYLDADVKILTGFIEPHFFAGFSGGPKAVLPSLAGSESVFTNHSFGMIADPNSTWGITYGNPIWEEMLEVALKTNPTFLLNVALNTRKEITGIFAGDLVESHRKGCEFVKQTAMVAVETPFDIVITTNSGYPLDQNLYQSIKGISAANQIVKKGGTIILYTACEDGLPDHGRYAELLMKGKSPEGVLALVSQPGFSAHDQWQVQIQAQIQQHANVHVFSDGLSEQQIIDAHFVPCLNLEDTLINLLKIYGSDARICVLPEGPLTIPYIGH
jgi:nickel-dependent lactate racemase